jgi:dinuclear metal center YbgI/SA1388 family protein
MMMLKQIVDHVDHVLDSRAISDYCPNGLQVEASHSVQKVVTGVSISQPLIAAAAELGAQLLIVHHGLFWKGEDPRLVGIKGQRIAKLYEAGISLCGYHLPLDLHPQLGNNAQLAKVLGVRQVEGSFYPYQGRDLGMYGELEQPVELADFADQLGELFDRQPMIIRGGAHPVRRIGWCSGGAEDGIEGAAALGLDAFLSGEISERTPILAKELGIHYISAGHHATERLGVQALAEHLRTQLGLEATFVDIDNPV